MRCRYGLGMWSSHVDLLPFFPLVFTRTTCDALSFCCGTGELSIVVKSSLVLTAAIVLSASSHVEPEYRVGGTGIGKMDDT